MIKELTGLINRELRTLLGLKEGENLQNLGNEIQRANILLTMLKENEEYCQQMLQYANIQNAQFKARELQLLNKVEQLGKSKADQFWQKGSRDVEKLDHLKQKQNAELRTQALNKLKDENGQLKRQINLKDEMLEQMQKKQASLNKQIDELKKQKSTGQSELKEKRQNENYFKNKENELNTVINKLKKENDQAREKYQNKFKKEMLQLLQKQEAKYKQKVQQEIQKREIQIKQLEREIKQIISLVNGFFLLSFDEQKRYDWIDKLKLAVIKYNGQMENLLSQADRNSNNKVLAYARFQKERLGSYRYYQSKTFQHEQK